MAKFSLNENGRKHGIAMRLSIAEFMHELLQSLSELSTGQIKNGNRSREQKLKKSKTQIYLPKKTNKKSWKVTGCKSTKPFSSILPSIAPETIDTESILHTISEMIPPRNSQKSQNQLLNESRLKIYWSYKEIYILIVSFSVYYNVLI